MLLVFFPCPKNTHLANLKFTCSRLKTVLYNKIQAHNISKPTTPPLFPSLYLSLFSALKTNAYVLLAPFWAAKDAAREEGNLASGIHGSPRDDESRGSLDRPDGSARGDSSVSSVDSHGSDSQVSDTEFTHQIGF